MEDVQGRDAGSIGRGGMSGGRDGWPRLVAAAAVLGAIVLAACPGTSGAAVTLGPEQILVTAPGAGAVITRAPFQIAFTDGAGHTVLSEVPGGSEPAGPLDYAPLSYLVGSDEPSTIAGGEYGGDLLSVTETGTEYSAVDVIAAVPSGEGVELTLSTNDPSGRELDVTVAPQDSSAIRVSAAPSDAEGVAAMADSFSSPAGEAFHGFGGRHNALDQHGQDFYDWIDQENIGTGGVDETELSPDGPQAAYYVQSSFVSNRGYGFLLDRSEISRWRMDSDRPDAWQTQVAAPAIDYVVAPGSMTKAIATLTSITGRQRVPPEWALAPMFDQEVEAPPPSPAVYLGELEHNIDEIAYHHLPVGAYRIEGWEFLSRPALEGVIARLHASGIRALVYFRPFVGQEAIGQEEPSAYNTAIQDGYVATTPGGEPYVFKDNFGASAALIDFTNPAAVAWWRERIDSLLELGADGFMLDFGEQVRPDMRFSDGSTGAQMHNAYPILYQRVTREAVDAFEASHPGRTFFFYTRSGYTGDPGTAA